MRLGVVGLGPAGQSLLTGFSSLGCDIAAVCDVDAARLERGRHFAPDAKLFKDFRRVSDDKSVDAVVIATPTHWQVFVTSPL